MLRNCFDRFALLAVVLALLISSAANDSLARDDDAPPAEKVLERMLPAINFNQVGLSDVVEFIGDITKANIEVQWDELRKAGIEKSTPVTMNLEGKTVAEVLSAILLHVQPEEPLTYKPIDKTIVISTEAKLKK